jgi:hypothetical protein
MHLGPVQGTSVNIRRFFHRRSRVSRRSLHSRDKPVLSGKGTLLTTYVNDAIGIPISHRSHERLRTYLGLLPAGPLFVRMSSRA